MSNEAQRDQQVIINQSTKRAKLQKYFSRFLKALATLERIWYWLDKFLGLLDGEVDEE